MTDFEFLQIEQAAAGCISGTLAEWPALLTVLRSYGQPVDARTTASDAKVLARDLWAAEKRRRTGK